MKIILFLRLLFSFNNIIFQDIINVPIYKYKEMKEIRYIYFYDLNNFNIDNIEIYTANNKIDFTYEYNDYYVVDLNNYYPLSCITIINNLDNALFSIKYNNENDFFAKPFAHINIENNKEVIMIDDLIIDEPKWSNLIYSKKKLQETKTLIELT